jgi:GDPmannose 4,6-dehydratase
MKKALITGVTGQDGAFLAHLLLSKNYEVHGIRRRSSSFNTGRIDSIYQDPHLPKTNFFLHYGDLTDPLSLNKCLTEIEPDEVYNLGAQSHVSVSFIQPQYTFDVNATSVVSFLELIRQNKNLENTRFYQASTSELFGSSKPPQSEFTQMQPQSPYAVSKLASFWAVKNFRDGYGMFASNGILFNHESQLRGETFVTRKITQALTRIKLGKQSKLYLGNLDSLRDWGHARDFVEAQYLILQNDRPDDFVIATGAQRSVRDFVQACCDYLGLDIEWQGQGISEKAIDKATNKSIVEIDERYFRPLEVDSLLGDFTKAKKLLGWEPKTNWSNLVQEMLDFDMTLAMGDVPQIKWLN